MKTVVKKKVIPVDPAVVKKLAAESLALFEADAKKRYDKAYKLWLKQDLETREALERMVTLLCRIARKNMWVKVGTSDKVVQSIPETAIYHNMFYMGIEILKDLAQFDIKVANFTMADLCVVCYSEKLAKRTVKKKKPGVVAKKKVKK